MTEFRVEVVRVTNVQKHSNADTLSTASANGYPVIFRTGEFAEGSTAVYVPVDSVVPPEERWAFLGEHRRIKAKRLRGIFSMGLLTAADPSWEVGRDVAAELRIGKYEPPAEYEPGEHDEVGPSGCAVYDIEGLRKHKALLVNGEEVWISEKLHGQNARFMHDGERLFIGSRTRFKKPDAPVTWTVVARRYGLAEKLAAHPGIAIYGETYGNNGDMPYGVARATEGDRLALFDALDTKTGKWFDVDDFLALAKALDLPVVPTLYRGPWSPDLTALAEGKTTLPGATHVREGIVIKPVRERFDPRIGRVFLKLHGEGYLLRK